jgi:hypothetical protein
MVKNCQKRQKMVKKPPKTSKNAYFHAHVELANKRRQLGVLKMHREHFFLEKIAKNDIKL